MTSHFFSFFLFLQTSLIAWIDVEESISPFVIETKQIVIPGYPDAFNPSLTLWQGSYLMSFRFRDPLTNATNQIGLVWLDSDFNLASDPYVLDIPFAYRHLTSQAQDPRLITIQDELVIVYNNVGELENPLIRRPILAKVQFDGFKFALFDLQPLLHFPKTNPNRHEKSWTPFEYNGELLLSYSINPHLVFKPDMKSCKTVAETLNLINWKWGELRGGTQALYDNGEYLSFFHSWIDMPSVQSKGKKISHYFMGAFTFQKDPPFRLTKISSTPIIGKNFYNGSVYNTWKPIRGVFPCGMVIEQEYIYVVYGRQDFEVWIVKIDKRELLDSLQSLDPWP